MGQFRPLRFKPNAEKHGKMAIFGVILGSKTPFFDPFFPFWLILQGDFW